MIKYIHIEWKWSSWTLEDLIDHLEETTGIEWNL